MHRVKLLRLVLILGLQQVDGELRSAVDIVRDAHPLEEQGGEDVVHLLGVFVGGEVHPPQIALVLVEGEEEKHLVVVIGELAVAVQRQPPEAHLDILVGKDLVEADLHPLQVAQVDQRVAVLLDVLLQLAALGLQGEKALGELADEGLDLLPVHHQVFNIPVFELDPGVPRQGHHAREQLLIRVFILQLLELAACKGRRGDVLWMKTPEVGAFEDRVVKFI